MKKFKLSDAEAKMLIFLLALLMLASSYFFVFRPCTAAAEEIEKSNDDLRSQITMLESYVTRQVQIEEETARCHETIEEIIAKYPPLVTTEKSIDIIQDMEDIAEMHVSDISFLMDNLITTLPVYRSPSSETVSDAIMSVGYYASLSINYQAAYGSFKEMVDYVGRLEDRMTIPTITAAYDDETGEIAGVVTINMFYLTETGKEYEPPVVRGIPSGVEDIFRSGGAGRPNSHTESENGEGGENGAGEGRQTAN